MRGTYQIPIVCGLIFSMQSFGSAHAMFIGGGGWIFSKKKISIQVPVTRPLRQGGSDLCPGARKIAIDTPYSYGSGRSKRTRNDYEVATRYHRGRSTLVWGKVHKLVKPDGSVCALTFTADLDICTDGARSGTTKRSLVCPQGKKGPKIQEGPKKYHSPSHQQSTSMAWKRPRDGRCSDGQAPVKGSSGWKCPVDAVLTPYIVLPKHFHPIASFAKPFRKASGAKPEMGDLARVRYKGKTVYAIYAESGPHHKLGEASVRVAQALGFAEMNCQRTWIMSTKKSREFEYALLPGSGKKYGIKYGSRAFSFEEIQRFGAEAFGAVAGKGSGEDSGSAATTPDRGDSSQATSSAPPPPPSPAMEPPSATGNVSAPVVRVVYDARAKAQQVHAKLFPQDHILLTFDDGPRVGVTDKILDLLKKHGIQAVFFPSHLDRRFNRLHLRRSRELVGRMHREGHLVGNHTYSHAIMPKISRAARDREIEKATKVLQGVFRSFGVTWKPRLFRFPSMKTNAGINEEIHKRHRMIIVPASIFGKDWQTKKCQRMSGRRCTRWGGQWTWQDILSSLKADTRRTRGVVLLHDLTPRTLKALEEYIPWALGNGYKFVRLALGPGGAPKGPSSSPAPAPSPPVARLQATPPPAKPVTRFVTASSLRVRKGPGGGFDQVASVKYGAKVAVLERRSGWSRITGPAGAAGWVSEDYLSASQPPRLAPRRTPPRRMAAAPSKRSSSGTAGRGAAGTWPWASSWPFGGSTSGETSGDCLTRAAARGQALQGKGARDLTKAEARDIVLALVKHHGLKLHQITNWRRLQGRERTVRCDGKGNVTWPRPADRLVLSRKLNGVHFQYSKKRSQRAKGYLLNVDARLAVLMWRLAGMLRERFGVVELYWTGIGSSGNKRPDCHCQGRCIDVLGVDGARGMRRVYDHWGNRGKFHKGSYRLENSSDAYAKDIFRAMYEWGTRQASDSSEKRGGNTAPTKLGAFSWIRHPDHPNDYMRRTHKDHFHFQVGNTWKEAGSKTGSWCKGK